MSKRKSKVNSDTESSSTSSSSESSSDDEEPKKKKRKKKKKTSQHSSEGGTPKPAKGDMTISQTKFQEMLEMISKFPFTYFTNLFMYI